MNLLKANHRIRDPIYGYIWLTEAELKIVDTSIFQRLRRISQLALTKYVYPTAEHSRFVHSLGVLQAATNIFNEVMRFNPTLWNDSQELTNSLKTLRFAALLHDIGHLPFSHAAEKFFLGKDLTHEDVGKCIIQNCPEITKEIENEDVSPASVASLLKKKKFTHKLAILKKFISDEFDADRADFLLRDSYFCGVKYGEYDYIRYAGSFRLVEEENGQSIFAIEKGNIHAVESFLLARYHYYLQVPYHRTRIGYDLVLIRYFKDLQERGILPDAGVYVRESGLEIDFERFQMLDDYSIFEQIKKDAVCDNPWARILMRQESLHPVFDFEKESREIENNFYDLQEELERLGLTKDQDFFVYNKKIEVHKILEKSDEKGKVLYPVVDKTQNHKVIGQLLDYSPILDSSSKQPTHIRRIYVTARARAKAEKALSSQKQILDAREKRRKEMSS